MNDTTYFRDYKPIEEDLGTKTNDLLTTRSTQSYKNNPKQEPEFSFFDFLRKSSVGALYRVGASFTIDALAIGVATGDLQSFCEDLDPMKLLRVATYVVGINFVDYSFDVTNKLDYGAKSILDKVNSSK